MSVRDDDSRYVEVAVGPHPSSHMIPRSGDSGEDPNVQEFIMTLFKDAC